MRATFHPPTPTAHNHVTAPPHREVHVTMSDLVQAGRLDSLPLEIILQILASIPDLATLCNLLYASRAAWSAFFANAARAASIAETVLSSGYTCPQIQFMIRLYAQVQCRKVPTMEHGPLFERAFRQPMQAEHRCLPAPKDAFQPDLLNRDTGRNIIYRLINTARELSNCSMNYLTDSLARLGTLEPQNSLGKDDGFGVDSDAAQPIGPPTWMEEQRVMRAFWRLQLAYKASEEASIRRLPSGKDPEDWWWRHKITIHRTIRFYESGISHPADCHNGAQSALYSVNGHSLDETSPTAPHPEYQEIVSVLDYIGERFGQDAADDVAGYVEDIADLMRYQRREKAKISSPDIHQSHEESRRPGMPMPPMPTDDDQQVILQPSVGVMTMFRLSTEATPRFKLSALTLSRYGLPFWCHGRLQAYGLAASNEEDSSVQARVDAAWLNLMSLEEPAPVAQKDSTRPSEN